MVKEVAMTASRSTERDGQSQTAAATRDQVASAPRAIPHGYDQSEFAPEQADRDFGRMRRSREADEERRHLRLADAAIGGRTRHVEQGEEKWDTDDELRVDGASRLYKD
jgi:hypothetical protein